MRVKKIEENYYEVHEGSRWWTVNMDDPENPFIMNDNSVIIKPAGPVGKKIMAAINEYQA